MQKIFLLDAYALIYRSYYALIRAPRINSKGLNTSAIMGFVNTLQEVITKEQPTHIAVAFDHGSTFRHEAYPPYKAQRDETPEDIKLSVPIIKDILSAWNIPILQVDGYEADDIIGAVAKNCSPLLTEEGDAIYMLTPDKDYGQLTGGNVFMYKPRHGGGYDILGDKEICEKYAISSAEQVIDLLALMGDSADNFPGCPGVGEKTAVKLINEWKSCENLVEHCMEVKGALGKKVQEHVEDIKISKFLARIATDIPTSPDGTAHVKKDVIISETNILNYETGTLPDYPTLLDMMKYQEPDKEKLGALFTELEFRNLAQKILGKNEDSSTNDLNVNGSKQNNTNPTKVNKSKKQQKEDKNQLSFFDLFEDENAEQEKNAEDFELNKTPHSYKLVETEEEAKKLCDFLLTNPLVCFDTETTSKTAIDAELVGMSFSVKETEAWYVSLVNKSVNSTQEKNSVDNTQENINVNSTQENSSVDSTQKNKEENKVSSVTNTQILEIFRLFFENENITKLGQNMKYDIEVLMNYNIEVRGTKYDTMIAHYLLQPELRHGMDYMAETILNYHTIHYDDIVPRGKTMANIEPEKIKDYACEDADVTLKLWHKLEPRLKEQEGLWALFTDVEMPLVEVLADMEMTGVEIDNEAMSEVSRIFNERMLEHEKKIYELAGRPFNINSPRQVGEILFDKMKIIEKPKKTKTGQYVTSEEVLQQLRNDHEVVAEILDYRGLKKLIGTYVDALPKLVNKKTQRIHTSFNQCVTVTGRLSSSDPNLQNIPVRGEDGKEIRKCFTAPLFFSADYSQIELRVMAHLSKDPAMMKAFNEGYDVHASTAATVYGKERDEVTRDERTKAKRANFGLIYGISSWGLSQSLQIDRKEAKALMDGFFATFPKVKEYMDESKRMASETGYATTLLHRRRYLPDINSGNATVRGFAERNAINAPIQGTAADIIKLAMIRIHKRFKDMKLQSKMILQVHDELNFSVVPEEKDIVQEIVITEMQNAFPLNVPLVADYGWGDNWLEAH